MDQFMLKKYGNSPLSWIELPDSPPANVKVINGVVFFPIGYPDSQKIVENTLNNDPLCNDLKLVVVDATEAAKADGALTCCSVLFQ